MAWHPPWPKLGQERVPLITSVTDIGYHEVLAGTDVHLIPDIAVVGRVVTQFTSKNGVSTVRSARI